jgi:hypothetical protein
MKRVNSYERAQTSTSSFTLKRTDPRASEYDRFDSLTRKLVQVPKSDVDDKRGKKKSSR